MKEQHPEAAQYKQLAREMKFHESKQFEADDQKVALVDIDETVCCYGEKRQYDLAIPIQKNIEKINFKTGNIRLKMLYFSKKIYIWLFFSLIL